MDPAKLKSFEPTSFPPVKILHESDRLRILVTGGSGFVGSHLVDRLMMAGHQVIVVDNMFTGRKKNVAQWQGHPNFQLIIHDVVEPIMLEVDHIPRREVLRLEPRAPEAKGRQHAKVRRHAAIQGRRFHPVPRRRVGPAVHRHARRDQVRRDQQRPRPQGSPRKLRACTPTLLLPFLLLLLASSAPE